MTSISMRVSRASIRWPRRGPKHDVSATGAAAPTPPPLGRRLHLARAMLVVLAVLSVAMVLQLLVVSRVQAGAAQRRAFDSFRQELALGTAPAGPSTADGVPLAEGAAVAFLEIPEIGVKQVVLEGTASGTLFSGPGHRRDTPLPGQVGTSVLLGRNATYSRPFRQIERLEEGDQIRVTTVQGEFTYEVIGVRFAGDPLPASPTAGESRLLLVSAAGPALLPNGLVRVDATLTGTPVGGAPRLISAAALPDRERAMNGDTRTLWVLVLWLQAFLIVALVAVWAWHRWGRAQAWIVVLPLLLIVGLGTAGEIARLLPNLL
jgi:sortase A